MADRPSSTDPDEDPTSAAHELAGDERLYTGEPVDTGTGLRRPQQMNTGADSMEGGGEWPDPDAPAAPGAPGWDLEHGAGATPGVPPGPGASDSRITSDHDDIRAWVEGHGGRPVRVPGSRFDAGVPQLDFLHGRGDRSLEPVDWDEWFRMFDANGLALLFRAGDGLPASVEFVRR